MSHQQACATESRLDGHQPVAYSECCMACWQPESHLCLYITLPCLHSSQPLTAVPMCLDVCPTATCMRPAGMGGASAVCLSAFVALLFWGLGHGRCWRPGRPAGCSCNQAFWGLDWAFIVAWPQKMGSPFSMRLLCNCRTLAKIVGDKAAPGLVTFTFMGIW